MHAKNHKMRRKGTERERRQGKDKTRYFLKVSKLKKSYRGIEYDTRLNVPYIQTQERVFEEPLLATQAVMTGGKYGLISTLCLSTTRAQSLPVIMSTGLVVNTSSHAEDLLLPPLLTKTTSHF